MRRERNGNGRKKGKPHSIECMRGSSNTSIAPRYIVPIMKIFSPNLPSICSVFTLYHPQLMKYQNWEDGMDVLPLPYPIRLIPLKGIGVRNFQTEMEYWLKNERIFQDFFHSLHERRRQDVKNRIVLLFLSQSFSRKLFLALTFIQWRIQKFSFDFSFIWHSN